MAVDFDTKQMQRMARLLNQLPDDVAIAAYDKGLRAAGREVVKAAKQKAPRGDRSKQTSSFKSKWSPIPLRNLIAVKLLKRFAGGSTVSALVGVKQPQGNQLNFIAPHKKSTKTQVYWGKAPKAGQPKENDFLKRAFDETRSKQMRAFVKKIVPEIRKHLERKSGRP